MRNRFGDCPSQTENCEVDGLDNMQHDNMEMSNVKYDSIVIISEVHFGNLVCPILFLFCFAYFFEV